MTDADHEMTTECVRCAAAGQVVTDHACAVRGGSPVVRQWLHDTKPPPTSPCDRSRISPASCCTALAKDGVVSLSLQSQYKLVPSFAPTTPVHDVVLRNAGSITTATIFFTRFRRSA
eukprot:5827433-Prymnesium_polylepis.1